MEQAIARKINAFVLAFDGALADKSKRNDAIVSQMNRMLAGGGIASLFGDHREQVQAYIDELLDAEPGAIPEQIDPMPFTEEVRTHLQGVEGGMGPQTVEFWRSYFTSERS